MKKLGLKILAAVAALLVVIGATGCQPKVISAYDIAVKNGFVGTEEEWLQSLKGLDGDDGQNLDINALYEEAKADGFVGSMSDFLKEYFSVDVGQNNDTAIIAHNMMSTVSVKCGFKKTDGITVSQYASSGSGIIYHLEKENGLAYILTNYHVVCEYGTTMEGYLAEEIYVMLHADDEYLPAVFMGGSVQYDVAVLGVFDSEGLKNSGAEEAAVRASGVSVGEKVRAVGNAAGYGLSVSEGIVSVESENISLTAIEEPTSTRTHRVIRTDAVVNKGNSGGGLYDANGQLVGLVNAKSTGVKLENYGYAIPIDKVCRIADRVLDTGKAEKAVLGVTVQVKASSSHIDAYGKLIVTETVGVSVAPPDETYAAYGILQEGDVIKEITTREGTFAVTRLYIVSERLMATRAGDTVTLKIERGGVEQTVQVTFGESHIVAI